MIPIEQMPRPWRLALFAVAVLILSYICLAPHQDLPPGADLIWDKAEHGAAWTILTGAGLVLSTRRRWAIGVFAWLFGAAIEIGQATMGWGRDGDWRDLLADTIGIAAAYVIWGAARWVLRRR